MDGFQESCQLDQVSVAGVCEPRWKPLWTDHHLEDPTSETGLRGLTAVKVEDKEELLVAEEGTEMRIIRVNPDTGPRGLSLISKTY